MENKLRKKGRNRRKRKNGRKEIQDERQYIEKECGKINMMEGTKRK